jgi:hypothetical protein
LSTTAFSSEFDRINMSFSLRFATPPSSYNLHAVTTALRARIKHFLKQLILSGLAAVIVVTSLAYTVDYILFRRRISSNRQPFGQVTVIPYYAVPQKSGKTQFIFNPPEPRTCAHALFPRAGYQPCWYLERHIEQRTDL